MIKLAEKIKSFVSLRAKYAFVILSHACRQAGVVKNRPDPSLMLRMTSYIRLFRCYAFGRSLLIILILSALVLTTGCEPFRKKFVRKKKEEKQQKFIPVLEPIEYPEPQQSSEGRYKYYYSLWKVWSGDLLRAIDEKESDKKQKYLVTQALKNLEEMKKWVKEDKQKEIDLILVDLSDLNSYYDTVEGLRNTTMLKRKIEKAMSQVRKNFNPKLMSDFYL